MHSTRMRWGTGVAVALAMLAAAAVPRARGGEAKPMETGFLDRSVTVGGTPYPVQVYVPRDYTPDRSWPVMLFLHGSGERGRDGLRPTQQGPATAVRLERDRYPMIIVFPQCPPDSIWMGEPAEAAMLALDRAMEEFHGDPDRVLLSGLSLGGYGVWHLAYLHPDRFAALVPICGGIVRPPTASSVRQAPETRGAADPYAVVADRLAGLPIWVFHGAEDPIIPVSEARKMVEALRARGAEVRYTELPGVGHGAWDPAYQDPALPSWLLEQRRKHTSR